MISRVRAELRRFLEGLAPVPATIFLVFAVMSFAYWYYVHTGKGFDLWVAPHLAGTHLALARCLWWTLGGFPLLVGVPVLTLVFLRRFPGAPSPGIGWGPGDWKLGATCAGLFLAVMIPVLLIFAVPNPAFQGRYPQCVAAEASVGAFVVYEVALVLYFVSWEYFFRGFLTLGLEPTFGKWAIFIQMLPFVTMHFDKPDLEALSSILAGIALGWLALRTRSFWWGAIIHGGVDVLLDLMMEARKHVA